MSGQLTTVRADFFLQFADSQGLEVSQYPTLQVGQTFDVYVYLVQASGTLLTDEGLFSAAFRLSYGSSQPHARVVSEADIQLNSDFQTPFSQLSLDSSGVNIDLANPSITQTPVSDPTRLFLASFRFTALSEGPVQLGFRDLDTTTSGFVTGNLSDLDDTLNFGRMANLNVVATPEPASITLALVGAGLLTPRVFKRLRKRA